MPRASPFVITLSESDRATLERQARSYTAPHAQVIRAKIVLFGAGGQSNTAIAKRLDVHVDVVSRWPKGFCRQGPAGLRDRARSGRPRIFAARVGAQVKAMACEPPAQREVPLARWSSSELARQAVAEGLVEAVSASTVRRWLAHDAIKPWRYRSWIFPRDPDFAATVGRVLDLDARIWEGVPLEADEYVISADEQSQLQALSRTHPERPPAPGRIRRVEFEYERHGTLAYFGAYDVHRAQLIGTIAPTTGIAPFGDLVRRVMTAEPYASARRVCWVVDKRLQPRGSGIHPEDGPGLADRHARASAGPRLVAQPDRDRLLIGRTVIDPADVADLGALAQRLVAFEPRDNATARPFDWTFTREDLSTLLRRIEAHQICATAGQAA